ncbi:MAG: Gram-negative bacterial TonB protein C-terminal [Verrucomicrobiota bacterium]|jgi:TonB family protein
MNWELPRPIRALINAFPDVNEQTPGRQALGSGALSLLLHLVAVVAFFGVRSGLVQKLFQSVEPSRRELELVLQSPPPPPPPVPKTPPEKVLLPLDQLAERPRVDSAGLQEALMEPRGTLFQSDKNLAGGSMNRPTGTAPLPTVFGRKNAAEKSLVQQEAKSGSLQAPPSSAATIAKLAGPNAGAKVMASAKKPAPKPQQGGESPLTEEMPELGGELVFRRIAAGPSATSRSGAASPSAPVPQASEAKRPGEAEPAQDLFREGKERTETKGGLAENGKTGVNASKTPVGAYMKGVSRAIGAHWNDMVKNRMDSLETGLVKVRFWVTPEGKVQNVVVERSTANKQFSNLCLEAVRAARLDPPPEEARPLLRDGLLEIPFTFSLY